ncbi:MAG: hypothetical protein FJ148_04210 [Deltaproteobacteria bacterium]|nr:hypothetical protein [Deltaproteobacteria bacterium]
MARYGRPSSAVALLAATLAAGTGCSDGGSSSPRTPAELGIDLRDAERCDVLAPQRCLLPLPNDFYTVADGAQPTGRRVAFAADSLPANAAGKHVDPTEWNRNDGFSPGSAVLAFLPGVDLAASGAARIDAIGRSLDDDSPTVIVDLATGERRPHWAELDLNAPDGERTLILRAAVNHLDGHRYAVAFRRLVDGSGTAIAPSPAFRAYRDGQRTTDALFEGRRAHLDEVFAALEKAGVARDDLQLAFDFTVASTESITGRMRRMRDDAFVRLGDAVPPFTVDLVEENVGPEIARRITGTFRVPSYLTGDGGPGSALALGADGLPAYQGTELVAPFQCTIPPSAFASDAPARGILYGHGLLGDYGEVNSTIVREMAERHALVNCATNEIGMAEEDVGNAVRILGDLSFFHTLADRLQQGLLNELFLGRLMVHPDGLAAHPAFRRDDQSPLLDRAQLYYDGNSQGAILGGALMAVGQDFTRGVLGEAGMNYSFLLQRSVDFDDYKLIYAPAYPDPYDQLIGIQIIQMLWDRGETNGYANHVTRDPLPGTPVKKVLLLGAVGDHQVSEYSLQIQARTMAVNGHVPLAAPDRTINEDKGWGIEPVPSYPWDGSAYFLFDTGAVLSPLGNVPPREGHDPHDDTPRIPAAQDLKSAFLRPDGVVLDVCNGTLCVGEQYR